jgi:hypothetical protein
MIKRTLAVASVAAMMLTPALAQSSSQAPAAQPTTQPKPPDTAQQKPMQFLQQQSSSEWRSSNLVGTAVTGSGDQNIGEIEDVLLDRNGMAKAVVVSVGGFLGIGDKDVAIPFSALTIDRNADGKKIERITVGYTKDQLNQAPDFKYLAEAGSTSSQSSGGTSGSSK